MSIRNERLCQLRDEAFSASEVAHDEMRASLDIFANKAYKRGITRVGTVFSFAEKSFDSEIQKGILKLIPTFEAQMPRVSIIADRSANSVTEIELASELEKWKDMYDEADNEGNIRHELITQFLTLGNTVTKEIWNPEQERCETVIVDPTSFAPDPAATRVDFSDASYVVHRTYHNERELQLRYPDWEPPAPETRKRRKKEKAQRYAWHVDEMWLRRDVAEWAGVDVSGTKRSLIRVVMIEDEVYKAWGSPYWTANYPFQFAKCFTKLDTDGRATQFWGFGYAAMMWEQQKVYDEVLSNAILVMRNQAVGRFISKEGTLDMSQIPAAHGLNLEISAEATLEDIQQLPSDPIPPAMFQWIQMLSEKMSSFIPSGNPVFSGEAPFSGASGRTVSFLQQAAFGLTDSQKRELIAHLTRRSLERVNRIQQFAHRPVKPDILRTALDVREVFPEDARHIGFAVSIPDTTMLPTTPVGKLEVFSILANLGVQVLPQRLIEILGLDKAYGIRNDDTVQPLPPELMGMMSPNMEAAMGVTPTGPMQQNAAP